MQIMFQKRWLNRRERKVEEDTGTSCLPSPWSRGAHLFLQLLRPHITFQKSKHENEKGNWESGMEGGKSKGGIRVIYVIVDGESEGGKFGVSALLSNLCFLCDTIITAFLVFLGDIGNRLSLCRLCDEKEQNQISDGVFLKLYLSVALSPPSLTFQPLLT